MTVILILNIVLATVVLVAVVGLLVWSVAAKHGSVPRTEMRPQTRRGDQFQPRPLDQPDPLRA